MNLKEIGKTTLNLVIFCAVVGFLLSFYNQMTKGPIAANKRKEVEEVQKKLLPADEYKEVVGGEKKPLQAWKAMKDGKFVGYIVKTQSTGYSSTEKIVIMYSVTPNFKVKEVNIVSQNETPGLGTRIDESKKLQQFGNKPFVAQFSGKTVKDLKIGSSPKTGPNHIAAITGATISSEGVVKGVHDSLEKVKQELQGGKSDEKKTKKKPPAKPKKPVKKKKTGWLDRPLFSSPVYAAEKTPKAIKGMFSKESTFKGLSSGCYLVTGKSGNKLGYAAQGSARSPRGQILAAVAVDEKLKIKEVRVLKHSEDSQYWMMLKNKKFLQQFKGKSYDSLTFKTTGDSDKCINAVTGATYSSKGVFAAVEDAMNNLKKNLKK